MTLNLQPGIIIDERYELVRLLAEGGMGAVFLAREIGLERHIALKVILPGLLSDNDTFARFERESQVLAALRHENIVKMFRFGIWQRQYPYIAMEYLQGETLRSFLNAGKVTVDNAICLVMQICAAMELAHTSGIVHRDLKPENIVVLNDSPIQVKVLDFGLSALHESNAQHLTQTGALIGSVHYMSPEQCLGRRADSRSDIYSLGCMLYEMLSGYPPFDCDNPIGLIHKHAQEQPAGLLSSLKLPDGLEFVVFSAMRKNPADRYQTMSAFRDDLKLVQQGQGELLGAPAAGAGVASKLRIVLSGLLVVGIVAAAYFFSTIKSQHSVERVGQETQRTALRAKAQKGQYSLLPPNGAARVKALQELIEQVETKDDGTINEWELVRIYDELSHCALSEKLIRAHLNHCLSIARVRENSAASCAVWVVLGHTERNFLHYSQAESALSNARAIAEEAQDKGALCDVYCLLSDLYLSWNRPDRALQAANIAVKYADSGNLFQGVTTNRVLCGAEVSCHRDSLKSFEKFKSSLIRVSANFDTIGACFSLCNTLDKYASETTFVAYTDQLITILDQRGDAQPLCVMQLRQGECLYGKSHYKVALSAFRKCVETSARRNRATLPLAYLRYGCCLMKLGRLKESVAALSQCANSPAAPANEKWEARFNICNAAIALNDAKLLEESLVLLNRETLAGPDVEKLIHANYRILADVARCKNQHAFAGGIMKHFADRMQHTKWAEIGDLQAAIFASGVPADRDAELIKAYQAWSKVDQRQDIAPTLRSELSIDLARALTAAGQTKQASEVYVSALKYLSAYPDHANGVRLDLSMLYHVQLKNDAAAKPVLADLIASCNDPLLKLQATQYLGGILISENRYDEAIRVLSNIKLPDSLEKDGPGFAESYYQLVSWLAKAYEQKNDMVRHRQYMLIRAKLGRYLDSVHADSAAHCAAPKN